MSDLRKRLQQAFVLLLSLSATGYFSHHALYGRHGLETRSRLIERETLVEFEIASLETVRAGLDHDIVLLAPELPNADLVEEIARDMLGYVGHDDRVIARR